MADSFATRLQGTGAHALELDGVARHFGALVALTGISMRIAAGERRAVLGSNGAGKTTLFNAITGDFMPTAGHIHFFGEDITELPVHERIRRGLRRTYQISQLFRGLNVRDSVFLACRGVSRRRFSLVRPGWSDVCMTQAESILHAVHLEGIADTLVATLSHGQQRQLEIALALAGAPRFILFDEPAAGLSPTERRDLVAILNALPKHIGYIIIEHDLDVALRVSEYVSMMHNGRVFKEGTPQEIENDPEVQEIYLGAGMAERAAKPMLRVEDLHVFYGESHAIQGVSLTLERGVLAVVGRNGMGKTTLCNTIVGLKRARSGSIRVDGREISALEPHEIHRLGVGYVPQGRRVWPSLTVDEHLRLAAGIRRDARWTVERIYQTFPRLAERRDNGGSQLSGGEQQMLAIARALLSDPKLLVMDEPTEGLAPRIVEQVEKMLVTLADEGEMAVLVIEQNIGVATAVSDQVAIMVNGRINRIMEARALTADRELQQRLLGVGRHAEEAPALAAAEAANVEQRVADVFRIERSGSDGAPERPASGVYRPVTELPNRWNVPVTAMRQAAVERSAPADDAKKVFAMPFSERFGRTVIVAGTFDTKGRELRFIADRLKALGMPVKTVDLSTSGKPSSADVPAIQVAGMHPLGPSAVMTGDRGASVAAMADAFARWVEREPRIGGIISAGGSGGTTLATAGMRVLPVGVPKIMVSTVAAGDVAKYVGAADVMMIHSVADVQGLNSITEAVLGNAAHAMAGMIAQLPTAEAREAKLKHARPALGITMFGVTTPAVQQVTQRLEGDYDCLVFHATGIGGRSMENLGDSRLLSGFIDLTTTEVADMIVGGVLPAGPDRFGAAIRTGLPYVGSTGALDMVNFGPRDTVPQKFQSRKFVIHNPNVTLMRTTRDENRAIGDWIGGRLNKMAGPVRFLLPEGGVSMLDQPGKPFHDPEADNALFEAIEKTVRQTPQRRVERVKANINDQPFVEAVVGAFRSIAPKLQRRA